MRRSESAVSTSTVLLAILMDIWYWYFHGEYVAFSTRITQILNDACKSPVESIKVILYGSTYLVYPSSNYMVPESNRFDIIKLKKVRVLSQSEAYLL